jgi:hypothetical protein
MDERLRQALEKSLFRDGAIDLEGHLKLVEKERAKEPNKAQSLEAQIKRLTKERDDLIAMSRHGSLPASVLNEIKKVEKDIQTLEHEHAKLPPKEFQLKELNALKATMQERIEMFRELLRGDVSAARTALRKLLDGRLKFAPTTRAGVKHLGIRGETHLGALVASWPPLRLRVREGSPSTSERMASPRGFELRLPP